MLRQCTPDNNAVERTIDFWRHRRMRCSTCAHEFVVDLNWIDRWEQGWENCPSCGLSCEDEAAPRVTVEPGDPALNDDRVARFFWYHTSTHSDWPSKEFNPAANLTPATRRRMGGEERVAAWAARQSAKALHVGTYEAAVHNMLRRMHNQGDKGTQFYLYRVRLKPTVAVRDGWLIDPSDWVGDVVLAEACPAGIDVARYLNYHEDPGGLSLALGPDAIADVQQVAVPLLSPHDSPEVRKVTAALEYASGALLPLPGKLGKYRAPSSERAALARQVAEERAASLPVNLRYKFKSAVAFDEGTDPAVWAQRASCLLDLVLQPGRVLAALDRATHRRL
jgi:hypothetical protein